VSIDDSWDDFYADLAEEDERQREADYQHEIAIAQHLEDQEGDR
jgi:hypothetical protein